MDDIRDTQGKPAVGGALLSVPETDIPHYVALGLTDKQSEFVNQFIKNGGNASDAARLAGYASPETSGFLLKNNPKIIAAINRALDRTIMSEGARLAWGVYDQVLRATDPKMLPLKVKVARHTLELVEAKRARAEGASRDGRGGKAVEDMSLEELRQFIASAQDTLESVKDVTSSAEKTIEHQEVSADPAKSGEETDG